MPVPHRLIVASVFAAALVFTGSAFAQTAAPAVPMAVPAPNCTKPGNPPSANPAQLPSESEMKRNNWSKSANAYLDCLKAFIAEQQAAAAPHIKAANDAVEEFNNAVKTFNDQVSTKP